ncbi:MAG: hypothetical protein DIZ80_00465 [endosymbiont of Galathealinum brachiosum]|uniref:Uncharacterized protein n=1 Tax=endosymbiont of Galathealinum brachiosum TaxID=2200906 RepID=A0A370DM46_9GAMM|nr:MAG: hypothetical protein DIZ80_00465 [endosymbiont of Galathealinum brachiosum]
MSNIADKIERNQNLVSSINQPLAVVGLEKIGRKMAGKLLTPAVWAANYSVNGKTPDKIDVSLFGTGLLGGAAGPASIITGLVKAVVDDNVEHRLKQVRSSEKPEVRMSIKPTDAFSFSAPAINAMKIASMGGTAWQHKNGLWVYITAGKNLLVPNFKPQSFVKIYRPVWPLQPMGGGKFRMTAKK